MADTKISALTAASAALLADEIAVNEAGVSKKVTLSQLQFLMGVVKSRVSADHVISTVAGTEVTLSPAPTLAAGTWAFQFNLIVRSATVTVSPLYGVNFTGTQTALLYGMRYWDSGPMTAGTGTADNTNATTGATAVGPISGQVHNVATTTTPILAHVGGVAATASNILVILEGLVVVTVAGDLELWHGSETATSTTIMTNSTLVCTRVA